MSPNNSIYHRLVKPLEWYNDTDALCIMWLVRFLTKRVINEVVFLLGYSDHCFLYPMFCDLLWDRDPELNHVLTDPDVLEHKNASNLSSHRPRKCFKNDMTKQFRFRIFQCIC